MKLVMSNMKILIFKYLAFWSETNKCKKINKETLVNKKEEEQNYSDVLKQAFLKKSSNYVIEKIY